MGLTSREYLVMYALLFEKPPRSLAVIARSFRVEPHKVYRIPRKALQKMKAPEQKEAFAGLLDLLGRTPENYRRLGMVQGCAVTHFCGSLMTSAIVHPWRRRRTNSV